MTDGITVIICTYNGKNNIAPAIIHLQLQELNDKINWEVIIVDNNSTDHTGDFAQNIWNENYVTDFSVVKEDKPGLMHARIKGISAAKYDFITFVDDDNRVEKDWVKNVYTLFKNHSEIAACGGQTIGEFESPPPTWFSSVSGAFACGKQLPQSGYCETLWGAGLSIRKSAWNYLAEHGFKSKLTGRSGKDLLAGEDSEICLAFCLAGYKLWYDENLVLKHYMPSERFDYKRMLKMNEGLGKAELILRIYRSLLNPGVKIHSHWLSEYMATLFYYFTLSFPVRKNPKTDKLNLIITKKYVKGYLTHLFSLKSNYDLIRNEIQTLNFNLRNKT